MTTLNEKYDLESETVTSENEKQADRKPKVVRGGSRVMCLLISVLIAIIIALSVEYATDIDPKSIVVEGCGNNTDFGDVTADYGDGNGGGRDMQFCSGGVRTASSSRSSSDARNRCYNLFYVGGCRRPYVLSSYRLRYGLYIVNCACNC
jgi:hypothetical protein